LKERWISKKLAPSSVGASHGWAWRFEWFRRVAMINVRKRAGEKLILDMLRDVKG
jgi:hypothetical protein